MADPRPNAQLQRRLLLYLLRGVPTTISGLARQLGAPRPSVSRAMHALAAESLVAQRGREWGLTDEGRRKAEALSAEVRERTNKTLAQAARAIEQHSKLVSAADLTALSSAAAGVSMASAAEMASRISAASAIQYAIETLSQPARQFPLPDMTSIGGLVSGSALGSWQKALDDFGQMSTAAQLANLGSSAWMKDAAGLTTFERVAESFKALPFESVDHILGRDMLGVQDLIASAVNEGDAVSSAFAALGDFTSEINSLLTSLPRFDLGSFVGPFDWPWLEDMSKRQRVEDAFKAAGFVPSPSMDQQLIGRVADAHESGASPDELAAILLAEYDADGCARLAALVDRLCASPDFMGREVTLKDALAAHQQRLDSITTYPLVSMIEGVVILFVAEVTGGRWVRHNQIAAELNNWPAWLASVVGSEGYACLVHYLEAKLYYCSDWKTEDPAARGNYLDLNRHRLLHGMASQGTRLNTLRCFLMLDIIEAVFSAMRKAAGEDAA